jgi:lipase (class 3)
VNKLRLIFVHGVSATLIKGDYTAGFCSLLRDELRARHILPLSSDETTGAEIVTFEYVNYSGIGQAGEERVLAAYEEEKGRLYAFLDRLVDKAGFDILRRQIITSISGVLVYESQHWRDEIRRMLLVKIEPYVKTGDAVSIVGHSLGSVVAFDTAYYNARHNEDRVSAKFKPTNLFTMGSPIALFSLELDDVTGDAKPRYAVSNDLAAGNASAPPSSIQPNRNDGVWLNFLDAQDLVAYPLTALFKGKFRVEDRLVQTGTLPLSAHTGYWESRDVAKQIADRLQVDFARINRRAS